MVYVHVYECVCECVYECSYLIRQVFLSTGIGITLFAGKLFGIGNLENGFYINKSGFSMEKILLYPRVNTLFAGIGILDEDQRGSVH